MHDLRLGMLESPSASFEAILWRQLAGDNIALVRRSKSIDCSLVGRDLRPSSTKFLSTNSLASDPNWDSPTFAVFLRPNVAIAGEDVFPKR